MPDNKTCINEDIQKILDQMKFNNAVIHRMKKLGVLDDPISDEDVDFLRRLLGIWGKAFFVRAQICHLSYAQRKSMYERRPALLNKWERYVYSIYYENEIEIGDGNRMLTPQRRIRVRAFAEEVSEIFGMQHTRSLEDRIRVIARMAQRDRSRAKKKLAQEQPRLEKAFSMAELRQAEKDIMSMVYPYYSDEE